MAKSHSPNLLKWKETIPSNASTLTSGKGKEQEWAWDIWRISQNIGKLILAFNPSARLQAILQ